MVTLAAVAATEVAPGRNNVIRRAGVKDIVSASGRPHPFWGKCLLPVKYGFIFGNRVPLYISNRTSTRVLIFYLPLRDSKLQCNHFW